MLRKRKTLAKRILCSVLPACLLPFNSQADTIVNVQTNLGEFKLELFEDIAPATVTHFLAQIEAGTYQFPMVHEATNVLITSGLYSYNSCGEGPVLRESLPSIPVENTGLTNTTRTIAMVPNAADPTTVGSQWVINMGNNEAGHGPNKPVVFGEVVEGVATVDNIIDAWRVPMDVSASVPTVNYDGFLSVICNIFNADNVIKVAMQIESVDPISESQPANVYDATSNLIDIKVDAGAQGLLRLSLLIQSTEPDVIVQAQPETVVALSDTVEGISTFDEVTGILTIPELVIDDQVAYTNLVLLLTDVDNLFFTLQSFQSP